MTDVEEFLSDLKAKRDKEKAEFDAVKLTGDQAAAFEVIKDWMAGEVKMMCLVGYAGTGKTFLSKYICQYYRDKFRGYSMACVAPTNKACQVLERTMGTRPGVAVKTIHSHLGLQPFIDNSTGREYFKQKQNYQVPYTNLLVCDEASMIGQELYELIDDHTSQHRCKILFIGDAAQLPPVGEDLSPTFNGGDKVELREIVRYGGEITQVASNVRETLFRALETGQECRPALPQQSKAVMLLEKLPWLDCLVADIKSEEYKKDPNFARALAWTNRVVDWGNARVHAMIYGENAMPFVPGQVLLAREAVTEPGSSRAVLMSTSDECTIDDVKPEVDDFGVAVYTVNVTLFSGAKHELRIIDPKQPWTYETKLSKLKNLALQETNQYRRRDRWTEFYEFKSYYAALTHSYWSTVHKAQGSTFKRCYVASGDIMRNPNYIERLRSLYTSYTRASDCLMITV